ncbi:unnamed protein product [Euphydryas editha]|uniref:ATPase AAA-type core domain-containing protein n=1 Tax=Euphydryas editha TaxID=104508 RepID=A0AAU9V3Q5_EUPED|nr:unnamed protein product [Euphydryas editha]
MTSDYYFKKWKSTLQKLNSIVEFDLEYQETKVHDKEICDAVQRLTAMLGSYIVCYNDALDCLQHNLQLQKTEYIAAVVKTIVARILELKHQLTKLEGAYFQFLCNGLIEQKLTPDDTEFYDIPVKHVRSEMVKSAVEEAFRKGKEIKEAEKNKLESETIDQLLEDEVLEVGWWEDENEDDKQEHKGINVTAVYEVEEKISEETLRRRGFVALIQAHERSRQIIQIKTHEKQKRELWEKELKCVVKPQAPFELRERSARLIQSVLRAYFELKRKRLKGCNRDELLYLNYCNKINTEQSQLDKEAKSKHSELYRKYENQRENDSIDYKEKFLERRKDDLAEEFREYIRDWFREWYEKIKFFYDIPKENQGGSALIIKDEVPSPLKWLEEYQIYLETKKANKNKTALQLKWERKELKKEEMALKKEELKKKKLEADLLKKMMKNPTLHPGYQYPASKLTENILTAIKNYYNKWSTIDDEETIEAKEKYIKIIDKENLCMEAKIEICNSIDNDMREELKILKMALKEEYKNNGEEMPKPRKEKARRKKKQRKINEKISEDVQNKLTNLATNGFLKEYPITNFENFIGDINFTGADFRCAFRSILPFGGEIRNIWWERCREVIHGFKKVLLIGPKASGRTTLVHIMATVNDAVLYELDPCDIEIENITTQYLQQLINHVAICAKHTQPSLIYIRHIERLFCSKVPPAETYRNYGLIKHFFIRNLFKKINKLDNITIIGSCTKPWLTKSKEMLKKFNTVLLLPETNYSAVHLILRDWMLNNRIVPYNLDIQSLARVLQGYPFGNIVNKLDNFLSSERIVHIAAHGLNSRDIYDYFLDDENETVIDYQRYLKWYNEKTHWGQLERKHLEERREFKMLVETWRKKMEKNKKQI